MNTELNRLPRNSHATRFWWIRHAPVPEVGEIMYGSLDVDCDTTDSTLFRSVAARLPANARWVVSPLKRTHQTAQALIDGGANAPEIKVDERISEMDFGDLNGRPITELMAERDDPFIGFFPVSPHVQTSNGESFSMLATRVAAFTESMLQAHPGEDVVCVAHRGTIMAALHNALRMPLDTSASFQIANVSLTRLWLFPGLQEPGPRYRVGEVGWLP